MYFDVIYTKYEFKAILDCLSILFFIEEKFPC